MRVRSGLKRTMLYGFIGAIGVAAVCGIWALLSGTWGELELRVLATAGVVAGASVLALGGSAAWEARRCRPLGALTMLAVGADAALLLGLIWLPLSGRNDRYWQAAAVGSIAAIALAHVSMLAMARLRRGHEVVRVLTVGAIAALALMLVWLILNDGRGADELYRVIGVVAILDAAGSITVPILHRVARVDVQEGREGMVTVAREVRLSCPRCEREQRVALGRSACTGCGLVITVEIEEEHCPKCGYVVFGLTSGMCPECGTALAGVGGVSSLAKGPSGGR